MKKYFLLAIIGCTVSKMYAQTPAVGIGTTSPDPTALFELNSPNKGFLMPRMGTAQRTGIPSPAFGLMVYDTDKSRPYVWEGAIWHQMSSNWYTDGVHIWNRNNGKVGIGTSTPDELLHISQGYVLVSGTNPALKFKAGLYDIGNLGATLGDRTLRLELLYTNTTGKIAFASHGEDRVFIHGQTANTTTMEFHQGDAQVGSLTANSLGDISITTTEPDGLIRLNTQLYVNATQNRVGIGTALPTETLQVTGNTLLSSGGSLFLQKIGGLRTVEIKSTESGSDGASMLLYNDAGVATIEIDADYGDGDGRVITSEIQIRGGSDLAENFDVTDDEDLQPGMLVSIDPKKEGSLCITNQAADKKIVGVVSGANGIKPGMLMGQQNSIAYGKYPVALTGRVYVLCTNEGGEIEPGDFLTSSSRRGYAKKASSPEKAQGAIIGKAMGKADPKTGFVLVLVNLQ